ncbi:MAG: hypothetical protein IPL39_19605 [Opitutaceae bacterium]|nr:hypothetical protein [Opitutaceae bacterium]
MIPSAPFDQTQPATAYSDAGEGDRVADHASTYAYDTNGHFSVILPADRAPLRFNYGRPTPPTSTIPHGHRRLSADPGTSDDDHSATSIPETARPGICTYDTSPRTCAPPRCAATDPLPFTARNARALAPRHDYGATTISLWLSRDPIGERGGVNLYGMVGNDPISYFDSIGLYPGVEGHGIPIDPKDSVEMIRDLQRQADQSLADGEGDESDPNGMRFDKIMQLFTNPKGFNTNSGNRFVFTCKYGWVDMGHFFRNAHGAYIAPRSMIAAGSGLVEFTQFYYGRKYWTWGLGRWTEKFTSKSGFAVEDLVSNAVGREFGSQIKYSSRSGPSDIAGQWHRFLVDAGAVNHNAETNALIDADMVNYRSQTKMPLAFTAQQGLEWQQSQNLWKCLCDGVKPRKSENQYK